MMICLLAFGLPGLSTAAGAAPAGQSFRNPGDSIANNAIEVKRHGHHYGRHHGRRLLIPIVPYAAYDYPYYYSRGFYPTYIGRGYVYYGYPYQYYVRQYQEVEYDDAPYSAKERCARRFRSFEWETGLYTTYGGRRKLCPYLR
jgi:hypothetical protein